MCRFSNGAHSTLHDNTTIVVNRKQKAYAGSHPPTKSSVVQKSEMYLFGGSCCPCYSGVACQNLGYQNGYHLCCGAFGNTFYPIMDSVSCGSSDRDLTTCSHQVPGSFACTKNNVAVACYNGTAPTGKSPVVAVACYNGTTPTCRSPVVAVVGYKGTTLIGKTPVVAVACYKSSTPIGKSPVVAVACYKSTTPVGTSAVVAVACYNGTTPTGKSAVVAVACYSGTTPTGKSPVVVVACYNGTTPTGKSSVVAVAC